MTNSVVTLYPVFGIVVAANAAVKVTMLAVGVSMVSLDVRPLEVVFVEIGHMRSVVFMVVHVFGVALMIILLVSGSNQVLGVLRNMAVVVAAVAVSVTICMGVIESVARIVVLVVLFFVGDLKAEISLKATLERDLVLLLRVMGVMRVIMTVAVGSMGIMAVTMGVTVSVMSVAMGIMSVAMGIMSVSMGIMSVAMAITVSVAVRVAVVVLFVRDLKAKIGFEATLERDLVLLLRVMGIVAAVMSIMSGEVVSRNLVLHLATEEDLGKGKTNGVTKLVEVLVVPLSLSVSDLMMDILTVDNQVVLNVEDEVPGVSECFGHLAELVEISTDGSLALFELVGNIMDDVAEILDAVKHRVEGGMLELIDNTTEAFPDVFGITEALDSMGNLSLNSTSKETLENLAHAEESEMNIRALHGLKVVHLLVLLVINLIKKLLPVVIKVKEKLLMVDHLSLSVEKHSSSLTKVLASIDPFAHAVVMKTLTSILKDVDTVNNK